MKLGNNAVCELNLPFDDEHSLAVTLQAPLGYVDGASLYQFVDSNPTALLDPEGTSAERQAPATSRPASGPTSQPVTVKTKSGTWTLDETATKNGMRIIMKFTPDKDTCPKCDKIRLAQIIQCKRADGSFCNYDRPDMTSTGWTVDYTVDDSKPGHSSIFLGDHGSVSVDGSNDGQNPVRTGNVDHPQTNFASEVTIETCAICEATGEKLSCVTWGYTRPGGGGATLTNPTGSDTPSGNWDPAVQAHNHQWGIK
jgi:hypothetical protein